MEGHRVGKLIEGLRLPGCSVSGDLLLGVSILGVLGHVVQEGFELAVQGCANSVSPKRMNMYLAGLEF